jgi:hypothetical protein
MEGGQDTLAANNPSATSVPRAGGVSSPYFHKTRWSRHAYLSRLLSELSATGATFPGAGHLEWLAADGVRVQDYLYTIRFRTRTVSFTAQGDEV